MSLFLSIVLQEWVATFEKPKGNPSAFQKPATTVLSPYLKVSDEKEELDCLSLSVTVSWFYTANLEARRIERNLLSCFCFFLYFLSCFSPPWQFGCLSSRYFYQCLQDVYNNVRSHTSPPVSLLGQVIFYSSNDCSSIPVLDSATEINSWHV